MGDHPFVPPELRTDNHASHGSSAATGGQATSYTFHHGLSRDGQALVIMLSSAALAVSLVAMVMMGWSMSTERARNREMIEAVERRAMDKVNIAERENRVTQEDMKVLRIALGQKGIVLEDVDHP